MSLLFHHRYRIPSARLRHCNYAAAGMYFVTLCTKNREHYFGEIIVETRYIASVPPEPSENDSQTPFMASCLLPMPLSNPTNKETRDIASLRATAIGAIAHHEWFKTPALRPDMNMALGEFVVMPNHIHGIVIIGENAYNSSLGDGGGGRDAMHGVSTTTTSSANEPGYKNRFAPQSKNLASMIRGYKSAVTTYARKNGISFDWQSRFHDHVIRSAEEYERISNYIRNNPANWQKDKFAPLP